MPLITFSRDDVRLELGDTSPRFPAGYRRKVDDHWHRINSDGRFFNGPVLVASMLALDAGAPRIELMRSDYAHYLYAAQDPLRAFPCRAVFSAAVILTSDNFLLLGQMAAHTSSPGQIQCPGGGIELGNGGEIDARRCCQREVAEELGDVFLRDPAQFRPLCLKSGGELSTVGLFYALSLDLTAAQAQAAFDAHQVKQRSAGERPEFDRLHAVSFDVEAIGTFIQAHNAHVVDYLAPLLVDGRHGASQRPA